MKYNFDEVIDRRGSSSLKWDTVKDGVIPLWVADMDFPCLSELREALAERAAHPFYGYHTRSPSYYQTLASWYRVQYGLPLGEECFLSGPGVVLSLSLAVQAFTRPGDGVLLFTPVYTPFYEVIRSNGRETVEVPLVLDEEGRFVFDTALLGKTLAEAKERGLSVPLAFFCSPHNPGGRVWDSADIAAFLDFAKRNGIITAADEIHGDFVYPPGKFISAASFAEHRDRVLVVSGANKSFNMGGIHVSHFVVRDEALRRTLEQVLRASARRDLDVFSELAVETVYRSGPDWLGELRNYLWENIKTAADFLNTEVPGLRAYIPQGGYLIWARAEGLIKRKNCSGDTELARRLEDEGRVKITQGSIYGKGGAGFVRINAASPRALLMEGLERIKRWAAGPENSGTI
ncbi:MAG: aminotransferase class I/II-fold pyridoxal phosphate-dependent enzyme [Treponema sp.]|jgi:cystathionine beta-lyase|nr:aminotransferase class I/II-fold pyridoxal phosphate-dependent enzyme [Treponema sp.]